MADNYYKALEITRNATDIDIKKAYRRLALRFHPKNNIEGSEDRFSQLGEAYEVLSDPRKKATYDKFGEKGLKRGIPLEFRDCGAWSSKYVYHGNPEQTFKQFFGTDNPFEVRFYPQDITLMNDGLKPVVVRTQGPPVVSDIHLSLDDLFHGALKKIKISRRVADEDGESYSVQEKILSLDVHPGWIEGTRINFPKEGDEGPEIIPADLVFIVRQKSHPHFERQHNDLIYKIQISLEMALTGFTVNVPTLDGRLLNIPITDIVHFKYVKVVPGEGMPLCQDPTQRGNLIIHFDIKFPEKLSPANRELIKQALK